MTLAVVNQTAYLRTSRSFPSDPQDLRIQLDKSYIDTANAINSRVIGIFPVNKPAITGEEWFIGSSKQQGFRQVYTINGTGNYPHGLTSVYNTIQFVRIYGTFTDGSFWYTLPWVSVIDATNQINIFISATNIVITGGGGGAQPTISSGTVVLEWISQP